MLIAGPDCYGPAYIGHFSSLVCDHRLGFRATSESDNIVIVIAIIITVIITSMEERKAPVGQATKTGTNKHDLGIKLRDGRQLRSHTNKTNKTCLQPAHR